jgi:hypothetical protein
VLKAPKLPFNDTEPVVQAMQADRSAVRRLANLGEARFRSASVDETPAVHLPVIASTTILQQRIGDLRFCEDPSRNDQPPQRAVEVFRLIEILRHSERPERELIFQPDRGGLWLDQ